MGERRAGRRGSRERAQGCTQEGVWVLGPLLGTLSLLQVEILGEDFSRLPISFPGVPFGVMVSTDWSASG